MLKKLVHLAKFAKMTFQPPIQFPVYVDGKKMKAFVLEEIDNPLQTLFKVAFSDGFVDVFLIEDDGNVYGSGIEAIPYARAIRFDIGHLVRLDPNRFYYNYQDNISGENVNIWVIEGENEAGNILFKVYCRDFFRFALMRSENQWIISHKLLHGRAPDEAVAKRTGHMLDALMETKSNA